MGLWTSPYVNVARSYLRRAGLTRAVAAPARIRNQFRHAWYRVRHPTRVDARIGGVRASFFVEDATEFVRVLSYRDDRAILSSLLETLRPGDVYWDIGASLGL